MVENKTGNTQGGHGGIIAFPGVRIMCIHPEPALTDVIRAVQHGIRRVL
jgi:hypothetical protein